VTVELTLLSRVSYRGQELTGSRLQGLLALLAGDLRTGCGTTRLLDELWPDEQPEHPAKALQILVSRARTKLGPDVIVTAPAGYRLSLREDQVDAAAALLHAAASARHLRAGDHAAALSEAEAGLALWDGAPETAGGHGDPLSALREERAPTQRSLVRARAQALARLGRHAEAVEPLAGLARDLPWDEEVLVELLRCEAATVGPSAALARYEAYRRSVRDELGSDPGGPLQAVHQQLLRATIPGVRHGVAHEPNPLLGRDDDIVAVANLLRTSRVTSIVGPGGLGKTRLAHAVSREAEQRVVHFVALAGVTTDDDVVTEVASALGPGEARAPVSHVTIPTDNVAGIASALGSGDVLLVLDNCEHVIRGVAELVRALVAITRDLRVLTTSRAPLDLSSEAVYLLPELRLPATVELFAQRARAARPTVELPDDVVEDLCRHLDGLPLAAELAAARVRTMSVAEIARGLEDRFSLLRGGARDAPERHRTLHAVVDWSWNLLAPVGQAAMRALSVFPGGFTADGARHLIGDGDALRTLEDLVDQSLLKVDDTTSGLRFSMLETVREFSAAQRDAAGETDRVIAGFLAWARDFGTAHHELPFGADPFLPVRRIRAEQDNLVQALRHGLDRGEGATVAAPSAVLAALWFMESNFARLNALADDTAWLLSHYRPEPELVEVTRTALTLCTMYLFIVHGPRPVRSLVALRRLPPAPPNSMGRAALTLFGASPHDGADIATLRDSDEPLVACVANSVASYLAEQQGDVEGALAAAEQILDVLKYEHAPWLWALANARIAELCLQLDRGAQARRHLLAALPVADEFEAMADLVGLRWWLVLACLRLGKVDEAERWLAQATSSYADGDVVTVSYGTGVRAEILLARGDVEAGLRLWRHALGQLEDADEPADDMYGWGIWCPEAQAVAVVAHAQHDRLDLVEDVIREMQDRLSAMLTAPTDRPFRVELPVNGACVLALAMVAIVRGKQAGDDRALRWGARMVALAEQFRYVRAFQPTMAPTPVRYAAEQADWPAYHDAVSSYAGLAPPELRAAALAALRERDHPERTGSRL
jgi:predicted ATPase/tetratricopeptide (TPR) repeat protein